MPTKFLCILLLFSVYNSFCFQPVLLILELFDDMKYDEALQRRRVPKTPDKSVQKRFKCDLCLYSTNVKADLDKHICIHIKEKPFECSYCSKGFTRKDVLVRHVRIHTKEKLFECSYCLKSFSQKSHLNNHTRAHTKKNHINQWFSNFLRPWHTLLPFQISRHTWTRVQIFFGLH